MYIKLGSTRLNYISPDLDDYIILSEIVDSSLSYHEPVLVRNTDELDIWFGEDFTDRDYFIQLLESGITLYLYKPISDKPNTTSTDYIDYSDYEEVDVLFYSIEDINENTEKKIFKVVQDNGNWVDSETNLTYTKVIFIDSESSVEINNLPQNLELTTDSINNRDTLVLYSDGKFLSPSFYSSSDDIFFKKDRKNQLLVDINTIDYESISSSKYTCSFKLVFEDNFLESEEEQYIYITTYTTDGIYNYDNKLIYNIDFFNKEDLINKFIELGYIYEGNNIFRYHAPIPVNYYYNLCGFSIEPEFRITNDIIYSSIVEGDISFISKTIGTGGPLGNIKITIIDLGDKIYRIKLERFGYSEVFEGSIIGSTEEIRLDHKITRLSKLVECLFDSNITKLPEGEWYLRGGKKESRDPDSYMRALDFIFNPPDPIYFDYLLIPDIKNYTKGISSDKGYYPEYETILNYSKELGNQVLIQNLDNWENILNIKNSDLQQITQTNTLYKTDSGRFFELVDGKVIELTDPEKISENTYEFNYTKDKDNILIYFYRDMEVFGKKRPGYYIYLNDLFFLDRYSPSIDYILYNSPLSGKDDYLDLKIDIENSLIEKKCNYLVENNHIYYYKKYQNGLSYNSTGWMRFCLGKIRREFSKNKWWILGDKDIGKIKTKILSILSRITTTFSIIRRVELVDFSISFQKQLIDITIDTYISDLVDNNVRIDITLNYYT